jgi:hypothetical protein
MILNELWPPEAAGKEEAMRISGDDHDQPALVSIIFFFFVVLFNPRYAKILQHPCKFHLGPIVSLNLLHNRVHVGKHHQRCLD